MQLESVLDGIMIGLELIMMIGSTIGIIALFYICS